MRMYVYTLNGILLVLATSTAIFTTPCPMSLHSSSYCPRRPPRTTYPEKKPWNFDISVALVLAHYYLARNMPCHGRGTNTEYWKRVLGVIDFLYRKIGGRHEQAPKTQGYQWVGRDECEYDVHQLVG